MADIAETHAQPASKRDKGPLVYRQSIWTRVTHWTWAICLFFLLLSGLQIFNAHPSLYIGQQSGFEFDNAVLEMRAINTPDGPRGQTTIFGNTYDTSGVFGMSGTAEDRDFQGFPSALTIPSFRDLATGRVVHFFFGWIFVGALFVWFLASFINGHLRRDIMPRGADLKALPADAAAHATLRLRHGRTYNPIQKLAYFAVFFVLFPLIILTGLTMSPGINASWPWLLDLFGGRQTARTIHFGVMVLLVLFFIVHILMVFAAGPINEMRSIFTGWYRASPDTQPREGDRS